MNYTLPKTVTVGGEDLSIRYDFRVILEIIQMLNDPDLDQEDKAEALLAMFFVDPDAVTDPKEAIEGCFDFIDMGERSKKKSPRLMDWGQDFNYIISPINRVLGREVREIPYDIETNTGGLHWWTFLSAYMEIGGDCMFSQLVSIRDKRARGKKLEKYEREWLRRNIEIVEFKQKYSDSENDLAKEWMGGGGDG